MAVKDLEDLKKLSMLRSQIDGISVERIMSESFPVVSSDDRISDVLAVMKDTRYQDVPVVDAGEYVGMVSYSSILRKKSVSLDTKVKGLVRNFPSVTQNMEITKIAEIIISNNCRQLPILNGKKIIGIIERNRLIEIVRDIRALKEIKVWEVMSNPVESVKVNDLMDDALELMIRQDYRTVPVVNERNEVTGIVGMREIIDNNWKKENKTIGDLEKSSRSQITVESIATTSACVIEWDDDISSAVDLMVDNKFYILETVATAAATRFGGSNYELNFVKNLLQETLKAGKVVLQVIVDAIDQEIAEIDEKIAIWTAIAEKYKAIMNAYIGIVPNDDSETGPLDGEGEGDDEE